MLTTMSAFMNVHSRKSSCDEMAADQSAHASTFSIGDGGRCGTTGSSSFIQYRRGWGASGIGSSHRTAMAKLSKLSCPTVSRALLFARSSGGAALGSKTTRRAVAASGSSMSSRRIRSPNARATGRPPADSSTDCRTTRRPPSVGPTSTESGAFGTGASNSTTTRMSTCAGSSSKPPSSAATAPPCNTPGRHGPPAAGVGTSVPPWPCVNRDVGRSASEVLVIVPAICGPVARASDPPSRSA